MRMNRAAAPHLAASPRPMSAPPVPSLAEASAGIADGTLSPVALCEQALARIAALEPTLNAFILLTADRARAAAATAEAEIKAGRSRGPLHGIPYALKDIYDVAGLPTTAHSRVLIGRNTPVADSDAAARLEAAGMVLLGKLATHEFARGGVRDDDLPFPPRQESVEPAAFRRRLLLRLGRGRVLGHDGAGDGLGYRRLHPAAGGLLRLRRAEADLWAAEPAGRGAAVLRHGPYRAADPHGRGLRPGDAGAGRARPGTTPARRRCRSATTCPGCGTAWPACASAMPGPTTSRRASMPRRWPPMTRRWRCWRSSAPRSSRWRCPRSSASRRRSGPSSTPESFAIHQQDLRQRPEAYGRTTRERIMLGAFVTGPQYVQAQRLRLSLMREVDALFGEVDAILCAPAHGAAPLAAESDDGPWRRAQPITAAFNVTGHPGAVPARGLRGEWAAAVPADRRPQLRRGDGAADRPGL